MPSRKAESTNRRCDGLTKYALNQPAGSDVKILLWLLLLPLMVTFVAFAIANRHLVTLSLDPTPLSIEAPLYGLVYAGIFAGLVTGGLIAWMRAGRVRRRLREEQRAVRRLEGELRKAKDAVETATKSATTAAAVPSPGEATDIVKAA